MSTVEIGSGLKSGFGFGGAGIVEDLLERIQRSFRARRTPAFARKQHAVLSFGQHVVERQQRGWLQDDSGTQNACRVHEKGAQTGDETLCGAQVGSTLTVAIEDL